MRKLALVLVLFGAAMVLAGCDEKAKYRNVPGGNPEDAKPTPLEPITPEG